MSSKYLILASLFSVAALSGCKERAADEPAEPMPPRTGVPAQETVDRPLAKGTGPTGDTRADTTPATPSGTADTEPERTVAEAKQPNNPAGAAQAAKDAAPSYRAELQGDEAKGSARFESDDTGLTRVMIDVQDAPKGTYQVHVFEGGDCKALESMETPFAGGPGVAGEGKMGTPGPKTTMALWKSLGTIDVDASGKGRIEVPVPGEDGSKMDQRLVVIFPEKDASKQNTKQAVIACGPVKSTGETADNAG